MKQNKNTALEEPVKYCTYIPHIVRQDRKWRVNAFTCGEYTKRSLEKMENTNEAIDFIEDNLEELALSTNTSQSLYLELGHFVDSRIRTEKDFHNGSIRNEDVLPGLNTISFWTNVPSTEGDGFVLVSKTFVVRLTALHTFLTTDGFTVKMDTVPKDLNDLSSLVSSNVDASPAIVVTRPYITGKNKSITL